LVNAQPNPKTFSQSDILAILKDEAKRARLVDIIEALRPDFDFSASLLTDWQTAGLTKEQIDAILRSQETRVVVYIRYLNVALMTYLNAWNRGFPPTLDSLSPPQKGESERSAAKANLIFTWLTSGHPGGNYTLVYSTPGSQNNDGSAARYTIVARPLVWREGVRSFFADQTSVIRETKEDRAATANDPPIPTPTR